MNFTYSFLRDELALIEIRKHKWLLSEQARREIGFPTAAIDWIRNYSRDFLQFRSNISNTFAEKRNFRRFSWKSPLTLKLNNQTIVSTTNDINLIGLSCTIPVTETEGQQIEVTLGLDNHEPATVNNIQFKSQPLIVDQQNISKGFQRLFVPFDDKTRNYFLEKITSGDN